MYDLIEMEDEIEFARINYQTFKHLYILIIHRTLKKIPMNNNQCAV